MSKPSPALLRRIHVLQHVHFEGPGHLETWARLRGVSLTLSKLYQDDPLPMDESIDGVVVLGGPMGLRDLSRLDWMNRELRFIEKTLHSGKPVLGICLGAQMLAHVLGARVYRGSHPEIGWHAVQPVETHSDLLPRENFPAFHWHGDTFDLPTGSRQLAKTDATLNQAFLWEKTALALQFHLEITQEGIEALLRECEGELIPGPYIQRAEGIRAKMDNLPDCHLHFQTLLDEFFPFPA